MGTIWLIISGAHVHVGAEALRRSGRWVQQPREKAQGTSEVTDLAAFGTHEPSQRGSATGVGIWLPHVRELRG